MKNKLLFVSLLSLFGIFISACSIHFTTVITEDGSGEFITQLNITNKELALIKGIGNSLSDKFSPSTSDEEDTPTPEPTLNPTQFCEDFELEINFDNMPNGTSVNFEETDEGIVCSFISPFKNMRELEEIYNEVNIEISVLEFDKNTGLEYNVSFDLSDESDSGGFEDGIVEYSWSLTVPGNVGDNNADEVEGRTLTWEIDSGMIEHFFAESTPANFFSNFTISSSFGWTEIFIILLLCLCGLAVLGGGTGLFFYIKKSKAG